VEEGDAEEEEDWSEEGDVKEGRREAEEEEAVKRKARGRWENCRRVDQLLGFLYQYRTWAYCMRQVK